MAKLNRARIVNLTYNTCRRVDDKLFEFGGGHTLFRAENGEGKTVLLQAFMQPILPKCVIGGRSAFETFKASSGSVYIMDEWLLDEENGFLLTGICFRVDAAAEKDKQFKFFTFTSEYKGKSDFTVENFPCIAKAEGGVGRRALSFEEMLKKLRAAENAGVKVRVFPADDQVRYKEYLRTFRISTDEQRKVARINESEGAIVKFFDGAQTARQLFTDNIFRDMERAMLGGSSSEDSRSKLKQEKLDRHLPEAFCEQLERSFHLLTLEKREEFFEEFKADALVVPEEVRIADAKGREVAGQEGRLHALRRAFKVQVDALDRKVNDCLAQLDQCDAAMRDAQFEEASYDHAGLLVELEKVKAELTDLREKETALKAKEALLDEEAASLKAAGLYRELVSLQREVEVRTKALEERLRDYAQEQQRLAALSYSLRLLYEQDTQATKQQLAELATTDQAYAGEGTEAGRKVRELGEKILGESKQAERLKAGREEFSKWVAQQGFDPLALLDPQRAIETQEDGLKGLAQKRQDLSSRICKTQTALQSQRAEKSSLTERRQKIETAQAAASSRLEIFSRQEDALKAELGKAGYEAGLSLDPETLRASIEQTIRGYEQSEGAFSQELAELDAKLAAVKNQHLNIPIAIVKLLKDRQVDFVTGQAFLANPVLSEEKRREYLENNPLLPFSLIIEEREMRKLEAGQSLIGSGADYAVPIFSRPSVGSVVFKRLNNLTQVQSGLSFLNTFDDSILSDEAALGRYVQTLEDNRQFVLSDVEQMRASKKSRFDLMGMVNSFYGTYPPGSRQELDREVKGLAGQLSELISAFERCESAEAGLLADLERLQQEEAEVEQEEAAVSGRLALLSAYVGRKAEDDQRKHSLIELDGSLRQMQAERERLEARVLALTELRNSLSEQKAFLRSRLESLGKESRPFADAPVAEVISGSIEELFAEKRALESKVQDVALARDYLANLHQQEGDLKGGLAKLGVPEEKYVSLLPNPVRVGEIEAELTLLRRDLSTLHDSLLIRGRDAEYKAQQVSELAQKILREFEREPKVFDYLEDSFLSEVRKSMTTLRKRRKELEKEKTDLEADLKVYQDEERAISEKLTEESIGEGPTVDEVEAPSPKEARGVRVEAFQVLKKLRQDHQKAKAEALAAYQDLTGKYQQHPAGEMLVRKFLGDLADLSEDLLLDAGGATARFDDVIRCIDKSIMGWHLEKDDLKTNYQLLVERCLTQAEKLYEALRQVDSKSTIPSTGKKMLQIMMEEPNEADKELKMRSYLDGVVSDLSEKKRAGTQEKDLLEVARQRLANTALFDVISPLDRVRIRVFKVETDAKKSHYLDWEQAVSGNSNGEKFVAYFIIMIALISFVREEDLEDGGADSKTILMDNPFGLVNSAKLLVPMFDLLKKYNTQLVCFTNVDNIDVHKCFDVVCGLKVRIGSNYEYIEVEVQRMNTEALEGIDALRMWQNPRQGELFA